jgi:hypothetical protein
MGATTRQIELRDPSAQAILISQKPGQSAEHQRRFDNLI